MSDFTPGVERAKKAGYKIAVAPYPLGSPGVRLSLAEIAKKIRDGRLDPDVRGWAGDVLIAAGKPSRRRDKVQALLDAFRKETMYVPDPVGSEYIAGAAATACLRPGLCVRARDCDDGVVFMGSAILSIGIPVVVVKQNFGPDKQEHVLVEFEDENGMAVAADPSTSLDVGSRVPAVSEERIDPMSVTGSAGTAGAEIVTLGAPPSREVWRHGADWVERRYGRLYVDSGLGWVDLGPCTCGVGACTSCEAYAEEYKRMYPLGQPTPAAPPPPDVTYVNGIAVGASVAIVAVAGGVAWGLLRRRAA